MNDLEKTFEYVKSQTRLSDTEKLSGRTQLISFMHEHPLPQNQISPFTSLFFSPVVRYAVVALLLISLSGGGVAFAAEKAAPSDSLYGVKVNVLEPVQIALTFDRKDRADLEVRLVTERLQELAEASAHDSLELSEVTLVQDSLTDQINGAQEDIGKLHTDQETSDAYETASDLESTLSAHAKILKKVQETNPDADTGIATVVTSLNAELSETNGLVDVTQSSVEDAASTTFDTPSDEQADDTADALAEAKASVAKALTSFDTSDRADINASLVEIQSGITAAQKKDANGDTTGAYILYTQANQKLTELTATIDADQSLGIDVIDATTTGATPDMQ